MSWFSKPKPAEVARIIPERVEQVRRERGGAFAAITAFYSPNRDLPETGDWANVRYIWGWCSGDVAKAVHQSGGTRMDEADFHQRLLSFVKMRGGKVKGSGHSVYVSARLPHKELSRGALIPPGEDTSTLPDDPRLIAALKKHGVDVSNVRFGRRS